jgi:hypothetical protein
MAIFGTGSSSGASSGGLLVAQWRGNVSDQQEPQGRAALKPWEKPVPATRPAGRRTSPPLASRLGADEFDRIVRGGDLGVVEEGMSALPVSSGGCRASRTAVTSPGERQGEVAGGLGGPCGRDVFELRERDSCSKSKMWSHLRRASPRQRPTWSHLYVRLATDRAHCEFAIALGED